MWYIYRITNKINGKTYIGQHLYKDINDSYMGSGKLIIRAQKKYGIENFTKEILYSKIQYKETADSMEIYAIKKERALGKAEYNLENGGNGTGKVSEIVRHKMCEAHKGKKHTEETKKKISESEKGKPKPKPADFAEKMSKIKKGCKGPNTGKKFSKEHKDKLSDAFKGKHWKVVEGKRVWY